MDPALAFSGTVMLADVDDALAPSAACTNPLFVDSADNGPPQQDAEKDGGAAISLQMEGQAAVPAAPNLIRTAAGSATARVSLDDCLACSGCVTTAETVLIKQQSADKFRQHLADASARVVVTVAPQSLASLAAAADLGLHGCWAAVRAILRRVGVDRVVSTTPASTVVLDAVVEELVARYKQTSGAVAGADAQLPPASKAVHHRQDLINTEPDSADRVVLEARDARDPQPSAPVLPLLCSACPGWVCYAEKAAPEVLAHMSSVRSPQAFTGALVKRHLEASAGGARGRRLVHVCVMPCFDKKLEAARLDFATPVGLGGEGGENRLEHDVDLVLATAELWEVVGGRAALQAAAAPAAAAGATAPAGRSANDRGSGVGKAPTEPSGSASAGGVGGASLAALEPQFSAADAAGRPPRLLAAAKDLTSGGYAAQVLLEGARRLWGDAAVDPAWLAGAVDIPWRTVKSQDMCEAEVLGPATPGGRAELVPAAEVGQERAGSRPVLRVAKAYGFRNIQTVLRRMRMQAAGAAPGAAGTSAHAPLQARQYHFVEVMACPRGCTNGGGQLHAPAFRSLFASEGDDPAAAAARQPAAAGVGHALASGSAVEARAHADLASWWAARVAADPDRRRDLYTRFHRVPAMDKVTVVMSGAASASAAASGGAAEKPVAQVQGPAIPGW